MCVKETKQNNSKHLRICGWIRERERMQGGMGGNRTSGCTCKENRADVRIIKRKKEEKRARARPNKDEQRWVEGGITRGGLSFFRLSPGKQAGISKRKKQSY